MWEKLDCMEPAILQNKYWQAWVQIPSPNIPTWEPRSARQECLLWMSKCRCPVIFTIIIMQLECKTKSSFHYSRVPQIFMQFIVKPWPKNPKQNTKNSKTKRPWADTKILWVNCKWTARGRTWSSPPCSVRTSSILYLLHHYQNANIQGGQILCRKDQMQVSHVEKNMVE